MDQNESLRDLIARGDKTVFVGAYDALSAALVGRHFSGVFLSGYSFSASHYGLPDIGMNSWSDVADFTRRVRSVLPDHHLLVDIDDGFSDPDVAAHTVDLLAQGGASGIVIEDQKRPRSCGHMDGKQLLSIDEFMLKLKRVIEVSGDLLVIARTDASESADILERTRAYAEAGADVVLADGLADISMIARIGSESNAPVAFNLIQGGKSPEYSSDELFQAGASVVIYSTPALFAAHSAVESAIQHLSDTGTLRREPVDLSASAATLNENLLVGRTRPRTYPIKS